MKGNNKRDAWLEMRDLLGSRHSGCLSVTAAFFNLLLATSERITWCVDFMPNTKESGNKYLGLIDS